MRHLRKLRNNRERHIMSKREDPDYKPLRGHVPINLYKRFKAYCVQEDMDNSEGLENVLKFYFDYRKKVAPKSDKESEFEKIGGKRARKKSV